METAGCRFVGGKAVGVVEVQNLDVHPDRDQGVAERDGRPRRPGLEVGRRHRDVVEEPELIGVLEAEEGQHRADEDADEQRGHLGITPPPRRKGVEYEVHADVPMGCLRIGQRQEHDDWPQQLGAFEMPWDGLVEGVAHQHLCADEEHHEQDGQDRAGQQHVFDHPQRAADQPGHERRRHHQDDDDDRQDR